MIPDFYFALLPNAQRFKKHGDFLAAKKPVLKITGIYFLAKAGGNSAMNSTNGKWYKIGEVARMQGIAVETIRMYEREGLLLVEKTPAGQRIFDRDDVHWIECIRRLIKEKGLNIEGIRRLLALLPCWNLRPCPEAERSGCPALLGAAQPCWTMKERIPEFCRAENCRTCKVYQNAIHCANLKKLMYNTEAIDHSIS